MVIVLGVKYIVSSDSEQKWTTTNKRLVRHDGYTPGRTERNQNNMSKRRMNTILSIVDILNDNTLLSYIDSVIIVPYAKEQLSKIVSVFQERGIFPLAYRRCRTHKI